LVDLGERLERWAEYNGTEYNGTGARLLEQFLSESVTDLKLDAIEQTLIRPATDARWGRGAVKHLASIAVQFGFADGP
jgi:hypothetical protein